MGSEKTPCRGAGRRLKWFDLRIPTSWVTSEERYVPRNDSVGGSRTGHLDLDQKNSEINITHALSRMGFFFFFTKSPLPLKSACFRRLVASLPFLSIPNWPDTTSQRALAGTRVVWQYLPSGLCTAAALDEKFIAMSHSNPVGSGRQFPGHNRSHPLPG